LQGQGQAQGAKLNFEVVLSSLVLGRSAQHSVPQNQNIAVIYALLTCSLELNVEQDIVLFLRCRASAKSPRRNKMSTIAEDINPADGEAVIRTRNGVYQRSSSLQKGVLPRGARLLSLVAIILGVLAIPSVRHFIGWTATRPFFSESSLKTNEHYIPGYWFGSGKFALPVIGEPLEFMRSSFKFTLERARRFGHAATGKPFGYDVVFLSGSENINAFYDHGNRYVVTTMRPDRTTIAADHPSLPLAAKITHRSLLPLGSPFAPSCRSLAFPQQFISGILGGHTILNMQDDATSPRFHERRDAFERALGYKRPSVVDQYLPLASRIMSRHLRLWEQQTIKEGKTIRLVDGLHLMCLEISTAIILGIEDGGAIAKRLLPFISDALNAGQSPPLPIPGTYFYKGMTSSKELVSFFSTLIEQHLNASGIVVSDRMAVSSRGGVLSSLFPLSRWMSGKAKRSQLPPSPHGLETLAKRWKTHLQGKGGETLDTLATEVLHTILATTALVGNSLSDTIIALHKAPEVRKRLALEVEELTSGLPWQPELKPYVENQDEFYDYQANSKGPWSYYSSKLLDKLTYNKAVTLEVRRLFPFVPGMFARAVRDFKVKSGGYNGEEEHDKIVTKDTVMVGSFYATSLDPTVWSNPLNFNPSRFIGPDREPLRRADGTEQKFAFSWVPHGSGAHQCPGIDLTSRLMELFNVHLVKDGIVWHLPANQNLDQRLDLFNPEPASGLLVNRWRATALDSDSF
jgi:cytochrome P450